MKNKIIIYGTDIPPSVSKLGKPTVTGPYTSMSTKIRKNWKKCWFIPAAKIQVPVIVEGGIK